MYFLLREILEADWLPNSAAILIAFNEAGGVLKSQRSILNSLW